MENICQGFNEQEFHMTTTVLPRATDYDDINVQSIVHEVNRTDPYGARAQETGIKLTI